ncbi:Na+/H+ antiporter NhaA [Microbacterium terricola]|uniref:Na(+)/H(+) antiporter NhaA n=1 Tax=Microbacterium terricola TaxID=344163 RepID=A0ABM8DZT3_9MICO|nr:Na+/H+ antiporter NhaA [Microbacterium terricola]UYK41140.1 Na+/H+ antiporter NhaA [Microbacterium terricola]BDV31095.1 Na(+)/H(+) antiporter NhaA 3 [Microbacterium terricola]
MRLLRSDRFPAVLLLAAAALGLIVANTAAGPAVIDAFAVHIGPAPFDLSLTHWVQDGLLAIFFFSVSVELQYELTRGELGSARRAALPAIAATGGVLVPIAIYLAIAAPAGFAPGWPIPTATDIAFALGVLAMFGRGLPSRVRVFLLALAILDDIVGIVFIAVLFATDLNLWMLLLGIVTATAFAIVSRMIDTRIRRGLVVVLILLAIATWVFVFLSGVHATIAGVVLGLAMAQSPALVARHALEPWINGLILPLFAFTAALVPIPGGGEGLSPAFWAILVALPVGKLVGVAGAGWLGQRLLGGPRLATGDLLAAGALAGIGFTVSLLLAALAFADDAAARDQATLGVLAGSMIALAVSAVLVSLRARHHRRIAATSQETP